MELSFSTRKLRSEALDGNVAERAYGLETAADLHARLADLAAAITVDDLPTVTGWLRDESQLRIRVSPTRVLVCEPVPPAEATDWRRVHRLKVLGIEEG